MDNAAIVNPYGETEHQAGNLTSKQYKDTLFRALFQDKKRFIELYNAIANENYPENTEIEPCPTNPIMAMFNDLAFLVGSKLIVLCEHQSTLNPNMPLRFLFYISDTLRSYVIDKDDLYRRAQVKIPTPEFYILYNGKQNPDMQTMVLSDAFLMKGIEYTLELTVKVVDIRFDHGKDVLEQSTTLSGYAYLIAEIENNISNGLTRDEAIKKSINICIEHGILIEYLKENYEGVVNLLTFEYDQEAERRAMRLDGKQEGKQEGLQEGIAIGVQKGKRDIIIHMINTGKSVGEISAFIGIPINEIQQYIE